MSKKNFKMISVIFLAIFVIAVWKLGWQSSNIADISLGCAAWHFVLSKNPVRGSPSPLSLFPQFS